MIIKTNRFIPKRFDAYTIGPFVLIRPTHTNDRALIAHEKEHVKQWLRLALPLGVTLGAGSYYAVTNGYAPIEAYAASIVSVFTHGLLYKVSKKYRYKCELEGHKTQYKLAPLALEALAKNFAEDYGFGITIEQARQAIRN